MAILKQVLRALSIIDDASGLFRDDALVSIKKFNAFPEHKSVDLEFIEKKRDKSLIKKDYV